MRKRVCPRFPRRAAAWVVGSMKTPLIRILSKFPQGGGADCMCVGGWGEDRRVFSLIHMLRPQHNRAQAACFRSVFSFWTEERHLPTPILADQRAQTETRTSFLREENSLIEITITYPSASVTSRFTCSCSGLQRVRHHLVTKQQQLAGVPGVSGKNP